jgi:hypothetical protein
MNPNDIVEFSNRTINYLEDDKSSFEFVMSSEQATGKLGFALIATAMAAFDTYYSGPRFGDSGLSCALS